MILLYHTYTIISAFLFFQITIFIFRLPCSQQYIAFSDLIYVIRSPYREFILAVTLFKLHVKLFHRFCECHFPFYANKEADRSTSVIKNYAL